MSVKTSRASELRCAQAPVHSYERAGMQISCSGKICAQVTVRCIMIHGDLEDAAERHPLAAAIKDVVQCEDS